MGNISIRRLDEHVIERLRMQAALHGVSMEEEVRDILSRSVSCAENIGDAFLRHFGPKNGVELTDVQDREPHEPMDFNE